MAPPCAGGGSPERTLSPVPRALRDAALEHSGNLYVLRPLKSGMEESGYYGDREAIYVTSLRRVDGKSAPRRAPTPWSSKPTTEANTAWSRWSQGGRNTASHPSPNAMDPPVRRQQGDGIRDRGQEEVRHGTAHTQGGPEGWQRFTVHAITQHPESASGYEGKGRSTDSGTGTSAARTVHR